MGIELHTICVQKSILVFVPIMLTVGPLAVKKHATCMYPCPCGHFQDTQKACTCSHQSVTHYQKRISDPLLNRIDIHNEVPRVDFEKLSDNRRGEASDEIRARVEQAR